MDRPPLSERDQPFDPAAPLAGAPEPWAAAGMPSLRPGPPYAMTEMIAAEPRLARRLVAALAGADSAAARVAAAVRATLEAGETVVVTGCGTSEHAAAAAVEILAGAARDAGLGRPSAGSIVSAPAFELALEPPSGGLVVGVSHEGGTAATNDALATARRRGATVAVVTAGRGSPAEALASAGLALVTGELDQAWCHTVGYLSPIVAASAVAAHLRDRPLDPDAVAGLVAAGAGEATSAAAAAIAADVATARSVVTIGSGVDRPAARELALKLEEGTWLPAAMRDTETFLHGHLTAVDAETAVVVVLAERRERARRLDRTLGLLRACRIVGARTAAILAAGAADDVPAELTPAGRIVVPEGPELAAPEAALLATATALQRLTEQVAIARGTNPDPIRRGDERYRDAAAAAAGTGGFG